LTFYTLCVIKTERLGEVSMREDGYILRMEGITKEYPGVRALD